MLQERLHRNNVYSQNSAVLSFGAGKKLAQQAAKQVARKAKNALSKTGLDTVEISNKSKPKGKKNTPPKSGQKTEEKPVTPEQSNPQKNKPDEKSRKLTKKKQKIVLKNKGLIGGVLKKLGNIARGKEEDLFQMGMVVLAEAVQKYDKKKEKKDK